jgi:hypothetical protein
MKWTHTLLAVSAGLFCVSVALAQTSRPPQFRFPDRIQNAQVLPADIGSDQLRDTMRMFSMSLGVRCTYCHVGEEGVPLNQLDFVSDANPHKNIARGMVRMVQHINQQALPAIAGLEQPRVTCYTCHRGSTEPATVPPPPAAAQPAAPAPASATPAPERG